MARKKETETEKQVPEKESREVSPLVTWHARRYPHCICPNSKCNAGNPPIYATDVRNPMCKIRYHQCLCGCKFRSRGNE